MPFNISDFSLFLCKNWNPLKKVTPSKNWGPVKAPLFENLVGGSTLPPPTPTPKQKEGKCTLCNYLPLTLPPLTRFPPGLFVVLQEILYQPFFALIRVLQKIMHFQSKTNFFFQLITVQLWFCCFVYMCFLGQFFIFLPSWNYR